MENSKWIGFYTVLRREVGRFMRLYKQTILPSIITAGLFLFIFGYALGSRISEIKGVPYMHFILPGLSMMAVINNAYSNTASSLFQAKQLKFLEDILIAPISATQAALAYILGGATRGFINGTVILFMGAIIFEIQIHSIFLTLLLIAIVSIAFSATGLIFGIKAENYDQVMVLVTFLITPLVYVGGVFYSIDMLPPFLRGASLFNPLYYMVNGLRYGTLGTYDTSPFGSIALAAILTVISFGIGVFLFYKGWKIKS